MNKEQILKRVELYIQNLPPKRFIPGETYIPPTAPIVNEHDVLSLMETVLEFPIRTSSNEKTLLFEKHLREFLGTDIRAVRLTNSGSSANLLAVTAITDSTFGSRQAEPKDEIITVAAGFPTTINPIIQNGLIPVFLDVDLDTLVPDPELIEQTVVPGKTKGIILAHPLGNPFDADAIRDIADEYGIWLIEDACDALGGTFDGKNLGSFGDMSTFSFYPAHHLCGIEAGAICSRSPMVNKVVESFRDWGRDCWCVPGKENTCGKRFDWDLGELPHGYDHKYTYSRLGYNLKSTEMSAALLVTQLEKLSEFTQKRRQNYNALREGLDDYKKFFRFHTKTKKSDPSWFGFLITVKEAAPFTRSELVRFLESRMIGTRLLFAGNITRQPSFAKVKYRRAHDLTNSDTIMRQSFWISVSPTLTDEMMEYILNAFKEFVEQKI